MQATVQLDNATFQVQFSDGHDDSEGTGYGSWEVNRKQLAELYKESPFSADYFNREDLEFDPECDNSEETVYLPAGDAMIVFVAAASQTEPSTYEIDYYGDLYWFFHDMIHAEYDSGDGTSIYIDSDSEERALLMGAELAAKHGVPISDILKELSKATPEFEERFKFEFDAVAAFLDSVEIVLK